MQNDGIGARIRVARKARGMTQGDLAEAVGVSRSAVAQWETDRAGQVRGNLGRIAALLDIPVADLVNVASTPAIPADSTELALLRLYRECSPEDRQWLLRTARRLARANAASPQNEGSLPSSG